MKALHLLHVETKMMGSPSTAATPYIHAKAIVVDGLRAYVGSINFSTNSLHNAREVGIIFQNQSAASLIDGKFNEDWTAAGDPPENTTGLCLAVSH